MAEKLYTIWAKRNPEFEIRYEDMLRQYCEYGVGSNSFSESRAKILGAGYEMYIIAFFIGLYSDRKKRLIEDPTKRKVLGQPIQYWGNVETRKQRKAYPLIREYIFMALVAKTDIDFIELDKGNLAATKAASMLIDTMEEYANFGFDFIQEKLEEDPNWLTRNSSLLNEFINFISKNKENNDDSDDQPDEL